MNRDEYIAPIPPAERHDMVLAYHAQLNSVDDQTRITAAKSWSKWESVLPSIHLEDSRLLICCRMATSKLFVDPEHIVKADEDDFAK